MSAIDRMSRKGASPLVWGAAARYYPGQTVSGDRYVIMQHAGGVLVGVVDALGHGVEANATANAICDILERNPAEPVIELIRTCHAVVLKKRGSRGAALSLASFTARDSLMTWVGVGNVEGMLFQFPAAGLPQRSSLLVRAGIVGGELPSLRAEVISIKPGDVLVFATDGVRPDFADMISQDQPPQTVADAVLMRHARTDDDALIVVARFQREG